MEPRYVLVVVILVGLVSFAPVVAATGSMGGNHMTITQQAPPDPSGDTIGWENGYWYNESISINQMNGLSEAELDAFLARGMARVEYIRGLEFIKPVSIEFVSRENLTPPRNDTYGLATGEQLWEALFIYGENVNASHAVRRAQRGNILGFAAEEGSDHIVIVDSTPNRPTVGGVTLIHELTHMLQDQHFNLSRPRYRRHTLDGEFAKDGLVEGAAAAVTLRYRKYCQYTWECVKLPSEGSSVQRPAPFRFYRLTYFPYSAGRAYIHTLVAQGGWVAVTAAHEQPPVSTEQVIHSSTDEPIPLAFNDTSRSGWTRVDGQPESLGEAGIYMLFWRRSAADSPISKANLSRSGPTVGVYSYLSKPSAGWGNDHLYAYTNGEKHGYVWKTVWDTKRDAREFYKAYIAILKEEGATRRGPHTWRIEDGPFADAFSVTRSGTVVTIVNGPTIAALDEIHATTGGQAAATDDHPTTGGNQTTIGGTPTTTGSSPMTTDGPTTTKQPTETTGTNDSTATTTAASGPGFGSLVALVAVVLWGIARVNRV